LKAPSFLTGLIISIILFLVAIITLVIFTMTIDENLVVEDYYSQDLIYQQQLDKANRTAAMGETLTINYVRGRGVIVKINDKFINNIIVGNIVFYRPSDKNLDRQTNLELINGDQSIDTKTFEKGLWEIQISWSMNDVDYYSSQRIIIN
jgi:nitrogen fixation protein FixH